MISLYWRAAMAAVLAFLLIALGWWLGSTHWKGRYEALQTSDAQARADALAKANARIEAQESSYAAKLKEILDAKDQAASAAADHADELASSLRDYQNRLRSCSVSARSPSTTRTDAAPAESSGNAEIERATQEVFEKCSSDAEQLYSLQAERAALNH